MANAFFVQPAAMTSVTASNTASGFSASVMANDLLGVVWRSTAVPSPYVQIDLGADTTFNTIAVLGLGGSISAATMGVSIASEAQGPTFGPAYNTGLPYPALLAGAQMPVSARGKGLWMAPSAAPTFGRYVRLYFTDVGASPIEVGRIIIGQRIVLARNFSFGAARGVRSQGSVDFSLHGVPLVQRGARLRTIGLTFNAIYADEVESAVQPLIERIGNDVPILLVTDPDAHSNRQNRIYFGYLTGSPGTIQARPGSYQADFALTALD